MIQTIEDRVWNAIPVTQQAFCKLLELLSIEVTDSIPTACVTLGNRSRLRLNPSFVEEHCQTNDRLAMLVMHELFHILLGHTRLFERVTQAQNWAFDAVINAHLCRLFPEPGYTVLFRDLYQHDIFPEALLRPPEGWGTSQVKWSLSGEEGRVHKTLYTEDSATYHELFSLLTKSLEGLDSDENHPVLLGNHETESDSEAVSPELVDEVRNIVAKWPMTERVPGRDQGSGIIRENIDPATSQNRAVATIRKAIVPLLDLVTGSHGVPVTGTVLGDALLPYRTCPDRRAELLEANGLEVFFYNANLMKECITQYDKVHVYVDVSGSMNSVLPLIYGALLPLSAYLSHNVHLFSTEIADVTPRELKKGVVITNCGTDIRCVIDHILKHKVRRAAIITDGWVGQVSDYHSAELNRKRIRINSILTYGGDDSFTTALKGKTFELCELDN